MIKLSSMIRLMAIATPLIFISGFVPVAQAQQAQEAEAQPLTQAFEDAYFRFDENFYRNRTVPRNLTWFIGPFPENEIAGDGRSVNRIYQDALAQQNNDGPLIRTRDADNPYQSSIMTSPIVPDEEPIPQAFASPYSRSPIGNGGSGNSISIPRRSAVPALW